MDLLILLTYDLIFRINNIVLPYLVMTEPFSGYTTMHGWSILVFCLFACVIVELKGKGNSIQSRSVWRMVVLHVVQTNSGIYLG